MNLVQCATDITTEAAKLTMAARIREDEAMERVSAAIADVDEKAQAAGATNSPLPIARVALMLTRFSRTNLAKPRDAWAAEKNRGRSGGQARTGPTAPDPAKVAFVPVEGPVWTPETP